MNYINCIDMDNARIDGCIEFKKAGDISHETNENAMLFYDDLQALETIAYDYGTLQPNEFRAIGYADVGENALLFMYGENDGHGVQIAEIDNKYFREGFKSGMTKEEIAEELTEMISDAIDECPWISRDRAEIDVEHSMHIAEKYLSDKNKLKQNDIER